LIPEVAAAREAEEEDSAETIEVTEVDTAMTEVTEEAIEAVTELKEEATASMRRTMTVRDTVSAEAEAEVVETEKTETLR
jgi:hypothetical protein